MKKLIFIFLSFFTVLTASAQITMFEMMLIKMGVKTAIKGFVNLLDNQDQIQAEEKIKTGVLSGATISGENISGANNNKNITGVEVQRVGSTATLSSSNIDVTATSSDGSAVYAYGIYHWDFTNDQANPTATGLNISKSSIRVSASGNRDSIALGIYNINKYDSSGYSPVWNYVENTTFDVHGSYGASALGFYGGITEIANSATFTVSSDYGKAFGAYVEKQHSYSDYGNENIVKSLSGTFNASITSGNGGTADGTNGYESIAYGLFSKSGEITTIKDATFNVNNAGTSAGDYAYGLYLYGNSIVNQISNLTVNVTSDGDFAGGIIIDTTDENDNIYTASIADMDINLSVASEVGRAVGISQTGTGDTKIGKITGTLSVSAPGEVFGYVVGRDISGDSDKASDVLTPGGTVFYNATTKDSTGFNVDWENITINVNSIGNQSTANGRAKGTASYGYYVGGNGAIDSAVRIKEMNVNASGNAFGIYTTDNGNFFGVDKDFTSSFNITSSSSSAYGIYAKSTYDSNYNLGESKLGIDGGIYGNFNVVSNGLSNESGAYGIYIEEGGSIGDIYGNFNVYSQNGVATGIFYKGGNLGTFYGKLNIISGVDNTSVFGLVFGRNDITHTESVGVYNSTDGKNNSEDISIGAGATISMNTTGINSTSYGLYATGILEKQIDLNFNISASAKNGEAYGVYLLNNPNLTTTNASINGYSQTGKAYAVYAESEKNVVSLQNTAISVGGGSGNVYGVLYGKEASVNESVGLYMATNKNSSGITYDWANTDISVSFNNGESKDSDGNVSLNANTYYAYGIYTADPTTIGEISAKASITSNSNADVYGLAYGIDASTTNTFFYNSETKDSSGFNVLSGSTISVNYNGSQDRNAVAYLSNNLEIDTLDYVLSAQSSANAIVIKLENSSSINNIIDGNPIAKSTGGNATVIALNDSSIGTINTTLTADSTSTAYGINATNSSISEISDQAYISVSGADAYGVSLNNSSIGNIYNNISVSGENTATALMLNNGATLTNITGDINVSSTNGTATAINVSASDVGSIDSNIYVSSDNGNVIGIKTDNASIIESIKGAMTLDSYGTENFYAFVYGKNANDGSSIAFLNTSTNDSSNINLSENYKITLNDKSGSKDRIVSAVAIANSNINSISNLNVEINTSSEKTSAISLDNSDIGTLSNIEVSSTSKMSGIDIANNSSVSNISNVKINNVETGIDVRENSSVGNINAEIETTNYAIKLDSTSSVNGVISGTYIGNIGGANDYRIVSLTDSQTYSSDRTFHYFFNNPTPTHFDYDFNNLKVDVDIDSYASISSTSKNIAYGVLNLNKNISDFGATIRVAVHDVNGYNTNALYVSDNGTICKINSNAVLTASGGKNAYGINNYSSIDSVEGTINVEDFSERGFGIYIQDGATLNSFSGTINVKGPSKADVYGISLGNDISNCYMLGIYNYENKNSSGVSYDWSKLNISMINTYEITPYRTYGVYAENTDFGGANIGGSITAEAQGNAYAFYLGEIGTNVGNFLASSKLSATTRGELGSRANTIYTYRSSQIKGKISGEVSISAANGNVFGLAYDNDNNNTPDVINTDNDSVAVYTHWNGNVETWSSSGIGIDFQNIRLNVNAKNGDAYGIKIDMYTNISDAIGGSIIATSSNGTSYGIVNASTNALNIADGATISGDVAIQTAGNVNFVNAYNTSKDITISGALDATASSTFTINEGVELIVSNVSSISDNISFVNNGKIKIYSDSQTVSTALTNQSRRTTNSFSGKGDFVFYGYAYDEENGRLVKDVNAISANHNLNGIAYVEETITKDTTFYLYNKSYGEEMKLEYILGGDSLYLGEFHSAIDLNMTVNGMDVLNGFITDTIAGDSDIINVSMLLDSDIPLLLSDIKVWKYEDGIWLDATLDMLENHNLSYDADTNKLTFENVNNFSGWAITTVPEPAELAMLCGTFVLCFVIYRRRK